MQRRSAIQKLLAEGSYSQRHADAAAEPTNRKMKSEGNEVDEVEKLKPKAKSTSLGQQQRNRHKGTVALNDLVYGVSKDANPFANARAEFVEWGYGGNWDRLHGGSTMAYAYDDRLRMVSDVELNDKDVELDDGSGLAWLKRRGKRERKAREQKEKDKSQNNTPIPTRTPTLETIAGVVSIPPDSLSIEIATTPHTPPAIDMSPLAIVPEGGEETATKFSFQTPTHPSEPLPSLTENEVQYFEEPKKEGRVRRQTASPQSPISGISINYGSGTMYKENIKNTNRKPPRTKRRGVSQELTDESSRLGKAEEYTALSEDSFGDDSDPPIKDGTERGAINQEPRSSISNFSSDNQGPTMRNVRVGNIENIFYMESAFEQGSWANVAQSKTRKRQIQVYEEGSHTNTPVMTAQQGIQRSQVAPQSSITFSNQRGIMASRDAGNIISDVDNKRVLELQTASVPPQSYISNYSFDNQGPAQQVNPVSDLTKMVTPPSPTLKPFPIKPELPSSLPHLSDDSDLLTSHSEIPFDDSSSYESLGMYIHNILEPNIGNQAPPTSVQQVFKLPHGRKQSIEELSSLLAPVENLPPNESTGVSWSQSCHCIMAETALVHVLNFKAQLLVAFTDVGFGGEYSIQVGFNQSALHAGMLVEEISIFLDEDLQVSEDDACTAFSAVFAPFPGVVYTPGQTYSIPVDPPTGDVLRTMQDPVGRTWATAANSGTTGSGETSRAVEANSTYGGHATKNKTNEKHQAGGGGGSGGPDDDDSDDSPHGSPKFPGGDLPKGTGDQPGVRHLNIDFSSTLSITTEGGTVSHELQTASGVSIKVCLHIINLYKIYLICVGQ